MSRRLELEQHRRQLSEIREIMRSMKNLALMETRKLARYLDAQSQAVRTIESAAADFLSFYPFLVAGRMRSSGSGASSRSAHPVKQTIVAIGSERGFCGDFNEEMLTALAPYASGECTVMAVGAKLCARLEKFPAIVVPFAGPSVAEDVPKLLDRLVDAIGALHKESENLMLTVLHHRSDAPDIIGKTLLPPFVDHAPVEFRSPPLLYLPPERFFAELLDHYLFAALHEIFYTSLMAENQRRMQHLEGAIQRLDDKTQEYARRCHTLRQEEITEEIEVILLSAEGLET